MKGRKPTPEKWFGRLLRLLPEDFRGEYGREMRLMFKDRYREQARQSQPSGIRRLWWETVVDIFKAAPGEHWDLLRHDTRSALRAMRRNRGFTAAAIFTLALGIGANMGVFSLVDGLLLEPPTNGRDLVRVFGTTAQRSFSTLSYPNYADLRDRFDSVVNLAAHRQVPLSLSAGALPQRVSGELVSGNYFSLMDVAPELGRLLQEQDDSKTAPAVAVIDFGLWRRLFGGGPQALGAEIRLFGKPFQVVGVAPVGFRGSYPVTPTQVWVPLARYQEVRSTKLELDSRGWGWLSATGRLRSGIDLPKAQSELDVLAAQLAAEHPRYNKSIGYRLHPAGSFPESSQSGTRAVLGGLLLVCFSVLLLVIANLGGVLLARALQRRRDLAIRRTLGATRAHIVRLWLTESLLMSLLGGITGIGVAFAIRKTLWSMVVASEAGTVNLALPGFNLTRTLLFSFAVTAACACALALLPAWRIGDEALSPILKEESATTSWNRRKSRLQAILSIGQVVVSVVLLAASGLLLRSLEQAVSFQPGFNTANLWSAHLDLAPYGYDAVRGREFLHQLKERLAAAPGVDSVTFSQVLPLSGEQESLGFRIEGHDSAADGKPVSLDVNLVGADYFAVMGIPVLEGRGFGPADSVPGAEPVAVVSRALANRFWPGGSALGKHLDQGEGTPPAAVVGVARDIRYQSLGEDPRPIVFGNAAQLFTPSVNVHMRVAPGKRWDGDLLKRTVASIDPDVAVETPRPFERVLATALLPQRILGTATAVFGALALVLTSIGLYALLSHAVQQRWHEFGIRMVMGAQSRDIMGLVLKRGLFIALTGIILGGALSIQVAESMRGLLFGVEATDPVACLVGLGLPLLVALAASCLPARRAVRVDPAQSIRRL